MEKKPTFNAAGFFESQGLKFKGMNENGEALVETDTGEQGTFNVKEFLASEGLNPDAKVTYNSPDQALNETPVGFMDRFKLSFGNTKGSVNYLKQNFEDANVNSVGDLVVKDKGVWKRVDLEGFGDDSGWKIAEVMADLFADPAGDIALGAAATGATIATVGTGGAASIPIAAAAGAAGSGVASIGTKQVLGRIMGTYDASPEEAIKDVAMDAILGAAGEGIALGAQKTVIPAMTRAFKRIGGFDEATQRIVAGALGKLDGNGPDNWRIAMANDNVGKYVQEFTERGIKEADFSGAVQLKQGLGASSSKKIGDVAEASILEEAKVLVKDSQAVMNKFYDDEIELLVGDALKDEAKRAGVVSSLRENGVELVNQVSEALYPFLSKTRGKEPEMFATAKSIRGLFGANQSAVLDDLAPKLAREVNNTLALAKKLSNVQTLEKEELKEVLKMTKKMGNLFSSIPPSTRSEIDLLMKGGFSQRLKNVDEIIGSAIGKDFKTKYNAFRGEYAGLSDFLEGIVGPVYNRNRWETSAENFVKAYRTLGKTDDPTLRAYMTKYTELIKPGGNFKEPGTAYMQRLMEKNSAKNWLGYSATTPQTSSGVIERLTLAAGRQAIIPVAGLISKAQRKASLRSLLSSDKFSFLRENAHIIKTGGEELLRNPEALGGLLTTFLSAAQSGE